MDRFERRLLALGRFGERLAGDRGGEPANELDEARGARVDDAGLAQDLELLGSSGHRFLAALDQPLQQLRRVDRRACALLRRVGQLADHRQHRPFDRLAHGAVGLVARSAERARDRGRVDRLRCAQHLGCTANDLREDHTRVAAGRHQRGPRGLARQNATRRGIHG